MGQKTFYANVSIGYAQSMYYLSSSGLECKVEKQATIDAKNYVTSESYVNAKMSMDISNIYSYTMFLSAILMVKQCKTANCLVCGVKDQITFLKTASRSLSVYLVKSKCCKVLQTSLSQ